MINRVDFWDVWLFATHTPHTPDVGEPQRLPLNPRTSEELAAAVWLCRKRSHGETYRKNMPENDLSANEKDVTWIKASHASAAPHSAAWLLHIASLRCVFAAVLFILADQAKKASLRLCYISALENRWHINFALVWTYLKNYIVFHNIWAWYLSPKTKQRKNNSEFQSNVPNLDYKKEEAAVFLVIHSPLCE